MFYREADIFDFYKEYDHLKWLLGEDVIELVDNGDKLKAVKLIKDKLFYDLSRSKKLVDRYVIYKNAYEDFKNDKTVYVEYKI
jgi:hypothetical protein